MSIELMKQALEALDDVLQLSAEYSEVRATLRAAIEHAERPHTHSEDCWRWHHQCAVAKIERAQTQEPVAWVGPSWMDPKTRTWQNDAFAPGEIEGWTPLYTAPPREKNS